MAPLRIAVLSDGGSFYAPRLLADVIDSPELSIEAVFVRTDGDSRLSSLRRVVRESGSRYAVERALALARLRRHQATARRSGTVWRDMPLPTWADAFGDGGPELIEISTANSDTFRSKLEALEIDLMLSTFYGEIVRESTLQTPKVGCVNVHPSLLPELRGTNPVFWALAEGLERTGLTAHGMVAEIDAGVLVGQISVAIEPGDTHHLLYRRIIEAASPMLAERITAIGASRSIEGPSQDHDRASYFSKPTPAAYRSMKANRHRFY